MRTASTPRACTYHGPRRPPVQQYQIFATQQAKSDVDDAGNDIALRMHPTRQDTISRTHWAMHRLSSTLPTRALTITCIIVLATTARSPVTDTCPAHLHLHCSWSADNNNNISLYGLRIVKPPAAVVASRTPYPSPSCDCSQTIQNTSSSTSLSDHVPCRR